MKTEFSLEVTAATRKDSRKRCRSEILSQNVHTYTEENELSLADERYHTNAKKPNTLQSF